MKSSGFSSWPLSDMTFHSPVSLSCILYLWWIQVAAISEVYSSLFLSVLLAQAFSMIIAGISTANKIIKNL